MILGAFDAHVELTAERLKLLIERIEAAGMIGNELVGGVDSGAELCIGGLNFLAQAGYFGVEVITSYLRGASAEAQDHAARAKQREGTDFSDRSRHTFPLFD